MPKTIVIADDELDALNILRDILESEGYKIFAVPDGRQAIDTVLKEKPDLLVVDNSMPEVQGVDVVRELRKHAELKVMKILFMSAAAAGDDQKAASDAGADAFLPKPFEIDDIIAAVRKLL